jgi:photosystem II stability/assembly factor-like uncharacterized protein/putative cell wall-binding protein
MLATVARGSLERGEHHVRVARNLSALCTIVCLLGAAVPLGAFATVAPTAAPTQTWSWQNPRPQGSDLLAVDFTDSNTGWAVGDAGAILHTANGGATWTLQSSGTTMGLNSIRFVDANRGWAVGRGGTILRTTDGGTTWAPQAPGTVRDLNSVHFIDADNGWAVGYAGTILATRDGGTTWTPQDSGTAKALSSVCFVGAHTGWAVGEDGTIVHTTNGGTTWTPQDSGMMTWTWYLNFVEFVDANTGWAVGVGGTIMSTTNGGATWTPQTSGTSATLYSTCFVDADTGWAVGMDDILKTTNGGATWEPQETAGWTLNLFGVHLTDANTGWVVGMDGRMFKTTNGGATWTSRSSGTTEYLESVCFVDENTGWAVGGYYTCLLRTTNGGRTWTDVTPPTSERLKAVYFTDASTGWMVGENGIVFATADGGATWAEHYAVTYGHHLESVYFTDANTGWAVGWNGVIRKTTDGGGSWTPLYSGDGAGLHSVVFSDASTGWAVGSGGTILATRDGGTTWTKQGSGVTAHLNSVFFLDASTGWVVGDAGTILATTDGGQTWMAQAPGTTEGLNSVCFADANNGWAVGELGTILASTDGGRTWTSQTSGTTNELYSADFVDAATGWVVGESGTILKMTTTAAADTTPPTTSISGVPSSRVNRDVPFSLSATDPGGSGVTATYYRLTPPGTVTASTVGTVTAEGTSTIEYWSVDAAGNSEATKTAVVRIDRTLPPGVTFDSVSGAGRYDTAVQAARRAFPASGSADTIVLATGANWPDALGGASLAGAYGGPLLLTRPGSLSPQVLDEARRLNVNRVVILGSTRAVSAAVENSLKAAVVNGHHLAVTRIGGAGRYDTAARIASATVDAMAPTPWPYDGTAFFATGGNFPDALAASPIAAAYAWPILLVRPDSPTSYTEAAIAKLGVKKGYMLGSDRAVSTVVETRLKALLPSAPTRLSGATRYDTGIAIARFGVSTGLHWDGVALATGTNFPDALAGGVMQGTLHSVVLLTPGTALNAAVGAELTAHKADIATVRYLGSTSALTQPVRDAVEAALK